MDKDKIKVIKEKTAWDGQLEELGTYDFYHTFDYHQISSNEGEDPVLLVYREGEAIIALPLLLREIVGSEYRDATSVYGYAGPIARIDKGEFNFQPFKRALGDFLESNQIISVFSRMNPYIQWQERVLNGLGEIRSIGSVVNIDLTKTLDEQRSAYRRDTRSRVNKARRLCTVRKAESDEDIDAFIDIYTETMEKLNADSSYLFDRQYFFDFLECKGFETDILLAIHNETNEITAGSMFVKTNDIVQYHLSGTKTEYMKIAPSRLLLDEMRITGTESGFTYFNLGGGYQSKEDALFNFKSSFSDDIRAFQIWAYISNEDAYQEMVERTGTANSSFFPAYRDVK